jgi:hypothetical protein
MLAALVFMLSGPAICGAQSPMQLPEPVGMDGDPAAQLVLAGNRAFLHGQLHTAHLDYRAALRRKPDFAVAAFNLGLVEVHEGQRTRGLGDMDRGISLADQHRMNPTFVAHLRALRAAFAAQRVAREVTAERSRGESR